MTGIIILAAGASSRLGQPKQNLIYNGLTLLQRAIQTALTSGCTPVVVILGANAVAIQPSIAHYNITVVTNPNWQEGMASSIKTGIKELAGYSVDDAVIMLCDQPFVSPALINKLIRQKPISGKPIIASGYNNIVGVPALFDVTIFDKLLSLQGDEGAKQILKDLHQDVFAIDFEQGRIDIDTAADYNKLRGA